MSISERLRNIKTILKTIDKGYHNGNTIEYIMDVFGTTMQAATDIISLKRELIDELLAFNDEEILQEITKRGLTKAVISYLTNSQDQDIPDKHYRIDVYHGIRLNNCWVPDNGQLYASDRNGRRIYSQVVASSTYLIHDSMVTKLPSQALSENFVSGCNRSFPTEVLSTKNAEQNYAIIEYTLVSEYDPARKTPVSRYVQDSNSMVKDYCKIENNQIRVWHLSKYYVLDSRFLTFNSRVHQVQTKTPNESCARPPIILSETYEVGPQIKIPLIDGVHVKTPIGFVTVKQIKVIKDWEEINQWSEADYDQLNNLFDD